MNDTALYVLALLSSLVAIFMLPRLIRSREVLLFKIVLGIILFVPVIGPLLYLWISHWPPRIPPHLNGQGAGLGRRYIESTQAPSGELTKVQNDIEAYYNERQDYEKSKRKSVHERLRFKRKLRARQGHNKAKQAGTR